MRWTIATLALALVLGGCAGKKGPRLYASENVRQIQDALGVVAAVEPGGLAVRSAELAGAPVRSFPRGDETIVVSEGHALSLEQLTEGSAVRVVFDPEQKNQIIRVEVLDGEEETRTRATVQERERAHVVRPELVR